jgi:hypothetical protein
MEFSSDFIYFTTKNKITDVCPDAIVKSHLCGICFWKGVIMNPNKAILLKCSKCKSDTKKFIFEFKLKNKSNENKSNEIKFKPDCCVHCIWWDWFDNIRHQKIGNKKIIYERI